MHPLIEAKRGEIATVCRQFQVRRLEVFGSAARGTDFDLAHSDADFLVEFDPEHARDPLEEFLGLQASLSDVLGRPVDLLARSTVERSRNYIRRRRILAEAQPIYVA
jgi:predicted nucleotidyltransferase